MDWLKGLGLPAGASGFAAAIYAAALAAEKAASKDRALSDISRFLENTDIERSTDASNLVQLVFKWTFGERHLSFRCIRRSGLSTLVFSTVVLALFGHEYRLRLLRSIGETNYLVTLTFVANIFASDYLALAKSRYLLRGRDRGVIFVLGLLVVDLLSSYVIWLAVSGMFTWLYYFIRPNDMLPDGWWATQQLGLLALCTTLCTSLWALLILSAIVILRAIAPVHKFTAWFFDVKTHPIQAIGVVAGALVIFGSLIWTGAHAIIN